MFVIIRGLPGSGKSTIAKAMRGFAHYEADMFFMVAGEYRFDAALIGEAHSWCQRQARQALSQGDHVVVSNTFSRKWEIQPYFDMCKEFGVEPLIVEAKGKFQNVHNVPEQVIQRMLDRWEQV
jgi:predicted kinase